MKNIRCFWKDVDVARIVMLAVSLAISLVMLWMALISTLTEQFTMNVDFEGLVEVLICIAASAFLGKELLKAVRNEERV
jgi:uncharacterized membrane protein YfcA